MAQGIVSSFIGGKEAAGRQRLAGLQQQAAEAKVGEQQEETRMKKLSFLAKSIENTPYQNRGQAIDREITALTQLPVTPKRQELYSMYHELKGLPEQQQNQMISQMVELGVARGFLAKPTVEKSAKPGQPKNFLIRNPQTNKFEVGSLQFAGNKAYRAGSDTQVASGDFRPIPKKGMSVTTPDGTKIQIGGEGGDDGLTPAVKTEAQKQIIAYDKGISGLERVEDLYDPKYLTWKERLTQKAQGWLEKAGVELTPEARKEKRQFNKFKQKTLQNFTAYLKQQSGVAISPKEFDRLQGVMPNMEDSPSEFIDKLEEVKKTYEKGKAIYSMVLSESGVKKGNAQVDSAVEQFEANPDPDRMGEYLLIQNPSWGMDEAIEEMKRLNII